jgi:hypothetical protein
MGTAYSARQSSYSDGDTIDAADSNDEFDAIVAAFGTSGHSHDGTAGEGGNVTALRGHALTLGLGTADTDVVLTFDGETSDGVLSWMEDEDQFKFDDDVQIIDNKSLILGTNEDITILYDESTNDSLEIAANVEGAALGIVLKADQGDDAGDEWKLNIADGGTLTLGNDINSAGTYVTHLTIVPNATVASSVATFAGEVSMTTLDIGGTNVTATATEINLLDGGTSVGGSITLTATDGFIVNDGGTMKTIPASDIKTFSATAADDIATGDAAVTLATSAGDITIDAQGNDTDIILKGTDGSSDTTFLTIDGSDAGTATFNNDVKLGSDSSVLSFGADNEITVTHVHNSGLTVTNTVNGSDDTPVVLQLKSEEDAIVADDVIASIEMAAGDSDGTDGATVAAGIHAIAEDTFSASANATKLVFTTGVSETAAASATAKMTLSSAGLLTIADDFMIKDGGTIGVASANDAMTISSAGIVTFKDDILIKDGGTIGVASSTSAITIASSGIVTFVDDILIKDAGTIGSASSTGAISIASSGVVTFVDDILIKDGGTIGVASTNDAMTISSAGIVTFKDDILIKDGGTIGVASAATAMTIASTGIVTFVDDIIIKDAGTIGSASDPDAIAIGSDGDVTLTQDLELQHDGAVLSFGTNDEITVTHVADSGLTLTNTISDTDNRPFVLQLKSEEDAIVADDVIASIEMAAGDSDGTDGATVAAGIHAIAEGTFAADANATKLVFTTGVSETAASSATAKMTLSSAGLLTIADDFMIKDGGTIGVASANDAMTISSAGIVTFKDDILIKDGGTIGNASVGAVMTLASTGIVTFADDIIIKDGGTIGVASTVDAMTVSSAGIVTFKDDIVIKDGGTIGVSSANDAMTISSAGIVTFKDDILIKDGGTIGVASTAAAITIAADGDVTISGNIALGDAKSLDISTPLLAGTDHTVTGMTAQMLAGAAISAFDLVCIHTTTSEVVRADASALATARAIGIAPAAISDTATGTVLLHGFVRDDTFNFTPGSTLFLSETTGQMTHTAPSTDGAFVQIVGTALSPDVVYINPSMDHIERA